MNTTWLKRLLERLGYPRRPRSPQPLAPGWYRLEAWLKSPGSDWEQRTKTVEVSEPVFASTLGSSFLNEIAATRAPGDTLYFDDVSVREA